VSIIWVSKAERERGERIMGNEGRRVEEVVRRVQRRRGVVVVLLGKLGEVEIDVMSFVIVERWRFQTVRKTVDSSMASWLAERGAESD
jgi:hypothetical protein